MAEEEPKKKINFKKIALFGLGPIVLIGIGLGVCLLYTSDAADDP